MSSRDRFNVHENEDGERIVTWNPSEEDDFDFDEDVLRPSPSAMLKGNEQHPRKMVGPGGIDLSQALGWQQHEDEFKLFRELDFGVSGNCRDERGLNEAPEPQPPFKQPPSFDEMLRLHSPEPDFGGCIPDPAEAHVPAVAVQPQPLPIEPAPSSSSEPNAFEEAVDPRVLLEQELRRLAKLDAIEFDRERRKAAARHGIRVDTLDNEVERVRREVIAEAAIAEARECDLLGAAPEPVDGAVLLSEISDTIRRYVVLSPRTADAAALWAVFTWLIDVVQISPLGIITAPEKRCGKSLMLDLLSRMVKEPISVSNMTQATLYRLMSSEQPTLLVDEVDTFLKKSEELRGILNSGHTRSTAYVLRMSENKEVIKFSTWGAKLLCGIGANHETLMDRGIIFKLRRKLKSESVERLRCCRPGYFDELRSRIQRWAIDNKERVRDCRPDVPHALNDRAQDSWEPLIAIAEVAGGDWVERARAAAIDTCCGEADESTTIGGELLADIWRIFESAGCDRMHTADLIHALCSEADRPWATFVRNGPITARQMSSLLGKYGLHPITMRIGGANAKGYSRERLREPVERYAGISTMLNQESMTAFGAEQDDELARRSAGFEIYTQGSDGSLHINM